MKALVTGGAGFIGSHMAEGLLAGGHEVMVIDNESTGYRENVPPGATYLKGDVTRIEELSRAFVEGLDVVFHIAGQASTIRSFDDPAADLKTNVNGTLNVLQLCLEHRVPRLLYASSMTTYGHPRALPIGEGTPLSPVSYYGVSKMAAERYVHSTAAREDLDFEFHATSFRMFNVYGQRQSLTNPYQGVVAIFIASALEGRPITIFGDGLQSRDFVHVSDVVEAWLSALDNPAAHEQIFNLGCGSRLSVNELVDVVLGNCGRSRADLEVRYEPVRQGDQRHMQADISRAESLLDWRPRVSFASGMAQTIKWAAEHYNAKGE